MGSDVASEPRRRSALFTSPAMRRSLSAAAAGSAGKRSPQGRRSSRGAAPEVEPFDIPQHDEEAERRQEQQQQAAADRRRSLPGIAGLSHGQLAAHYASCVKLSAENKINTKNAFSLQLIDCMAQMMRQKKSDLDNFQVASYTLDASAKIYGYRVEALHGETLRMAGGLGRADGKPKEDGDTPAGDDGAAPGAEKRRRKTRRMATVRSNLAAITGRSGGAAAVSGAGRTPWAAAEDGRPGCAAFLSLLWTRDDGQELMVDGEGRPAAATAVPEPPEQQPPAVTVPAVEERVLCPPLERFSFTSWSVDQEQDNERMEMPPPPAPPPADPRHRFDMNAPPHSPIAEEDPMFGGMDDDCDDGADGGGGGDTLVTVGGAGCRPAERPTLVSMVSAVPQEYSYFDQPRLLAWAGPRHWKPRLPAGAARPAVPAEPGRRRRRKEIEPFDYDVEVDWKSAFAVPKKATQLKQATMKKWSDEKTTLPEDLHYDVASLFKLFLRPDMRIVRDLAAAADSQSQVDLDGSVADYDYDNDRDTADYCPDVPLSEGCDDYDQEATFLPSGGACDASELLSSTQVVLDTPGGLLIGDNLVQAPKKVERILIPYARTAKKMDMRKLKAAMWEILADRGNDDKENATTPSRSVLKEAVMPPGRDYSFRELYHRLPSHMSTKMADNLSVALAFTALLHTANERCLRITGTRRMEDFFIAQDTP
ncbi:condensin complex subunit 2-like [Amphibalanus amphitrite]|nr:condensin complex subunit 2-like [Amphibalanus amphitrite]